jgi:hypothetical protein
MAARTMSALFFVCLIAVILDLVSAQESINAQEGFEVGKQVGIALAISFSILTFAIVTVNVLKAKCLKKH